MRRRPPIAPVRRTRSIALAALVALVAPGCEGAREWLLRQVGFPVGLEVVGTCTVPHGVAFQEHDPRLAVAFSGDGQVYFERRDGSVHACDVETGEAREVWPAHPDGAATGSLALQGGGHGFLTARSGETLHGSFADGTKRALPIPGGEGGSAISADGSTAARTAGGRQAWIQRVDGDASPRTVESADPFAYGIALSPDGRWLAGSAGGHGASGHRTSLGLWDLADGGAAPVPLPALERHPVIGVWKVAFSADGSLLAADSQRAGRSGVVVREVPGGKVRFERDGFDAYWTRAVALSPDGRWLATGDEKGRLRLWDLRTGEQMGDRDVYAVVSSLAFSPDGRHLAALLSDDRLLVVRIDEPEDASS